MPTKARVVNWYYFRLLKAMVIYKTFGIIAFSLKSSECKMLSEEFFNKGIIKGENYTSVRGNSYWVKLFQINENKRKFGCKVLNPLCNYVGYENIKDFEEKENCDLVKLSLKYDTIEDNIDLPLKIREAINRKITQRIFSIREKENLSIIKNYMITELKKKNRNWNNQDIVKRADEDLNTLLQDIAGVKLKFSEIGFYGILEEIALNAISEGKKELFQGCEQFVSLRLRQDYQFFGINKTL